MTTSRFETALVSLAFVALVGCDDTERLLAAHEDICRKDARIIIHNGQLWREYLAGAEKSFRERSAGVSEYTSIITVEHVPGFDYRYGPERLNYRPGGPGRRYRRDRYIYRGGTKVATFIDYVQPIAGFAANTSLDCAYYEGLYPELLNPEYRKRQLRGSADA